MDLHYNGFCNSVLWQLFHYVPLNIDSWLKMSEHRAMQMQWQAYQVGRAFLPACVHGYLHDPLVYLREEGCDSCICANLPFTNLLHKL